MRLEDAKVKCLISGDSGEIVLGYSIYLKTAPFVGRYLNAIDAG